MIERSARVEPSMGANEEREAEKKPVEDVALLEHYLAKRDEPCPKCRYNLCGMSGDACPECGVRLFLRVCMPDTEFRRVATRLYKRFLLVVFGLNLLTTVGLIWLGGSFATGLLEDINNVANMPEPWLMPGHYLHGLVALMLGIALLLIELRWGLRFLRARWWRIAVLNPFVVFVAMFYGSYAITALLMGSVE
jgi:hypothetical protein